MIKILKCGEVSRDEIFARTIPQTSVEDIVAEIIENVRARGDAALFEYCEKFDKAALTSLQVTEEEIDEAVAAVEPEFLDILREAAANIRCLRVATLYAAPGSFSPSSLNLRISSICLSESGSCHGLS